MKQCEKCFSYEKWYDDLIRSGDDVILDDEEPVDKHYCHLYSPPAGEYPDCIPQSIIEDKEECDAFIPREKI